MCAQRPTASGPGPLLCPVRRYGQPGRDVPRPETAPNRGGTVAAIAKHTARTPRSWTDAKVQRRSVSVIGRPMDASGNRSDALRADVGEGLLFTVQKALPLMKEGGSVILTDLP